MISVVAIAIFHVRSEDDGSTAAPLPTSGGHVVLNPPVAQTRWRHKSRRVPPITEAQPSRINRWVEKRSTNGSRRPCSAPVPVVILAGADRPYPAGRTVSGRWESDPSGYL
jgi:hypothetical protein